MPAIDEKFMALALGEAEKAWGRTSPNPMVGAVLVKDGKVVGKGCHRQAGLPHAEVEAIKSAGQAAAGATLYVTLEPCSTTGRTPPCVEAIKSAKIREVVAGTPDANPLHAGRGLELLAASGIVTRVGVLEEECRRLNRAFFRWITAKVPFVLLKMAMTLDGKIADASGHSKWITGSEARSRVQKLRRWADAIMVSGKTLRCDQPRLTVREPENWDMPPRRIVATRTMSQAEVAAAFADGKGAEKAEFAGRGEFNAFLRKLGNDGVTALLVEGGGELAGTLLAWNAVDAVEFHLAPKLLGGRSSRTVVAGDGFALESALELENMKSFFVGRDLVVTADVRKGA